jgi:hypothetical protein
VAPAIRGTYISRGEDMDPQRLDTDGLLREILQELRQVRTLLEERVEGRVEPKSEEDIRTWVLALSPTVDTDQKVIAFLQSEPKIQKLIRSQLIPISGEYQIVYEGQYILGASDVSNGHNHG